MFLTRSEYDRGVNTFSPEGRIFQVIRSRRIQLRFLVKNDECNVLFMQVEYAIEAIKLGSTVIGISTSEGVVLVVEKRITSPLMEPSAIEKIAEVDKHVGLASSGLTADSKTLIDRARLECQNHWFTYNENMSVESVAQAVSNLAIKFGDSDDDDEGAMSRPFGVALLFAGVDDDGPQLYCMDPSGTYVQYDAKAIGSGSEGAQQTLVEMYNKASHMVSKQKLQQLTNIPLISILQSMTLKEAIKTALTILKQVMEEKLNSTNVEVACVTPTSNFHMFSKAEVETAIQDVA